MKHKFLQLILFSCIISINAFAQPVIRGQKVIGGNGVEFLDATYLTNDGGLIVGGISQSNISGQKTENTRGGLDYWVVKLDGFGKIQWDKTIGSSGDDYLTSLQQTSDGGYILGGSSASGISGEKTDTNRGSSDYWVVKLNNNGKIEWDKTIGGNFADELECLQQTSDGGYLLGGSSFSNKSGEKTDNIRGGYDYWLVKLNSSGGIQWDKTIGGNRDDHLWSLQQTSDGGYILGGYSASPSSGEKTENSRGANDYWLVKLNSSGVIQWDKTIGGNRDDQLSSLQQTINGGYILGGMSSSDKSGEKTQNSRGGYDYWVVKLNEKGNIQWDKTIGGNSTDELLISLQQTSDSGYILGGTSSSNKSGEKTENSRGSTDYWVVKLNNNGKIQWDKTIGGNNGDYCWSVKEIGKNHYIVGGTSGSGITGDKRRLSRGGDDYWIFDLVIQPASNAPETSLESSLSLASIKHKDFSIYPNPAKNEVHVQISGTAIVSLTDQSGKVLLTTTITGSGIINVAGLKPGVYYLKNTATGGVQKVIVSR